jgi:hypothetical protein
MSKPGRNLNTLGRTYEIRGNGADYSQWRDKPLYGWITHMPVGWVFHASAWDTVHARRPILFRFRGRLSALDGRPCWHMVTGGPRANDKRGVIDSLKAMRDA